MNRDEHILFIYSEPPKLPFSCSSEKPISLSDDEPAEHERNVTVETEVLRETEVNEPETLQINEPPEMNEPVEFELSDPEECMSVDKGKGL